MPKSPKRVNLLPRTRLLTDRLRSHKLGWYARNADSLNQKKRETYARNKALKQAESFTRTIGESSARTTDLNRDIAELLNKKWKDW